MFTTKSLFIALFLLGAVTLTTSSLIKDENDIQGIERQFEYGRRATAYYGGRGGRRRRYQGRRRRRNVMDGGGKKKRRGGGGRRGRRPVSDAGASATVALMSESDGEDAGDMEEAVASGMPSVSEGGGLDSDADVSAAPGVTGTGGKKRRRRGGGKKNQHKRCRGSRGRKPCKGKRRRRYQRKPRNPCRGNCQGKLPRKPADRPGAGSNPTGAIYPTPDAEDVDALASPEVEETTTTAGGETLRGYLI